MLDLNCDYITIAIIDESIESYLERLIPLITQVAFLKHEPTDGFG